MRSIFYVFSIILVICTSGCQEVSKTPVPQPSLFNSLYDIPDLQINLTTDLAKFVATKADEKYQEATLSSSSEKFVLQDQVIDIRTRGVTRKSICDFPPIMLRITDEFISQNSLAPYNKIKLVTHCKDSLNYNQLVLKELLTYKLYNTLTDSSFRVKRVLVTYKDSKNQIPDVTTPGFFIEPDEEMAARLGGPLDEESGPLKTVQKDYYQNLVFFQYMVGNTDWNLGNRHNIRVVAVDAKAPLTVPYDFDYCGLVNAPYAHPHPMLPISSIQERLFQWRGSPETDFSKTVDLFNRKKEAFYKMCQNIDGLRNLTQEEISNYLDEFYTMISSPEAIKAAIEKSRG